MLKELGRLPVVGLLPFTAGAGIGLAIGNALGGLPTQMAASGLIGGAIALWAWRKIGALVEAEGLANRHVIAMDFIPGFISPIGFLGESDEPIRAWVIGIGASLLILAFLTRHRFAMKGHIRTRWTRLGALAMLVGVLVIYGLTLSSEPGPESVVLPMLDRADPVSPLHALMSQAIMLFAGDDVFGQNFTSSLPGVLSVAIVAAIISDLRMGRLLGMLSALSLAFSHDFWRAATRAGYASITAALVSILLAMAIGALYATDPVKRTPVGDAEPITEPGRIPVETVWGMAFTFGLGVGHSPTVLLAAPALILSVALSGPKMKPTQWLMAALLLVLGLLPMVMISGSGVCVRDVGFDTFYSNLARPDAWRDTDRWIALGSIVLEQYGIAGVALAIVGLARLARWYPRIGPVTLLAYGTYVVYGLGGGPVVGDALLPMHIIQAVWMAYAVHAIGQWLGKYLPWARHIEYVLVHTAFSLLPMSMIWTNWPH